MLGKDKNETVYYFKVRVREGAPGWADDDSYTSYSFKTFADTYKALVFFKPRRYWCNLRCVQRMQIWREGYSKVNVYRDGYVIEIADLAKLGVSEEKFDEIIASIDNKV